MKAPLHITFDDKTLLIGELSEDTEGSLNTSYLLGNEFQQYDSISNRERKNIFLLIRQIARKAGIGEITYHPSGKPYASDHFLSISHAGKMVALLYSKETESGIDLEWPAERIRKIRDRFLCEEETELCQANELMRLTLMWSAKEAIFKKWGESTVFFRENQRITQLDEASQTLHAEIIHQGERKNERLKYQVLANGCLLVYTM